MHSAQVPTNITAVADWEWVQQSYESNTDYTPYMAHVNGVKVGLRSMTYVLIGHRFAAGEANVSASAFVFASIS